MDVTTLNSWLHQFTAYFVTHIMSSNGKVLLAAIYLSFYLSNDAITWYQSWQEKQLADHLPSGLDDEPL